MPIDASIISGLRQPAPVQLADPLEQYGKSLTLRSLIGQGDLQQMQIKQAQQAEADDQMVRQAYMQGGDPATIRARLLAGGGYKAAQALDTAELARRKGEADITHTGAQTGKLGAETIEKTFGTYKSLLPQLSGPQQAAQWLTAQYNDPVIGPRMQALGPLEKGLASIPQDPQGFKDWQFKASAGIDKFMDDVRKQEQNKETNRAHLASEATARANTGIAGGNLSLARQRFEFEQNQPRGQFDSERGLMIDPRTGVATPVTMAGAPLGPKDKKLTESEGKAGTFGMRARAAADILDSVGDKGKIQPGTIKRTLESVPLVGDSLGTMANITQSPKQQQVEQAQRDFVNAVLRLESGASISPSEFDNAKKQYFPQPGDSQAVIEQKRMNRETEIAGLAQMAGAAGKNIKTAAASDSNAAPTPDAIPGQRAAPKQTAAVKIRGDDGYNALAKGTRYVGPDGIERVK